MQTQDVVWKSYREQWMIGMDGERESRKSVLVERLDDDYDISQTPLHNQDATQNQFLNRALQIYIQSFSSPRLAAISMLKSLVCPTIYPWQEEE